MISFLRTCLAATLLTPLAAFALPGARPMAKPFTTVKTFDRPQVSGGRLTFDTQGVRLNGSAAEPQELLINVPESHQGLRLAHIELTHSQNLAEKSHPWNGSKDQRDETAAYSSVEVNVAGQGWTSLGQPKKFPEARQEVERLHDLPDPHGKITAVRVRNVGIDPVHVHGVALHFLPARPQRFDEAIFTPATSFGDPWNGKAPAVARVRESVVQGGTRYPGGVTLNNAGDWAGTAPATLENLKARGWSLDQSSVVIPLEAGKQFRSAEVAIGDTHPDPKVNKDGSFGYKGFAKLDMTIERSDGSRVALTDHENIPPQGVLVGSSDQVVRPGDKLRIRVTADTAGLMGVRVGYSDL